jgi:uncharacterized protein YndB with AHSA1/START domain
MMVGVRTTRVSRIISAPRARVYGALLDADALAKWKVPTGMTCRVETFEPREGGRVRVSLTYEAPNGVGKTSARTDTYDGRLVELVPNERVVEIDEFDTDEPSLQGEMRVTISLADVDGGGTEVVGLHEGIPPGVALSDNQLGWESALSRLAALVEGDGNPRQRAVSMRP